MSELVGRRERKKAETRCTLARAAMRLALRCGVENVTAEAITEAADVAPRTDLVRAIPSHPYATSTSVAVTGLIAINIDASDKLSAAMLPYLLVVIGVAFLLLMLVFARSWSPSRPPSGSCSPSQHRWAPFSRCTSGEAGRGLRRRPARPGGELHAHPDDRGGVRPGHGPRVFLVTRMREEYLHASPWLTRAEQDASPRRAVVVGFGHSARVVTAAHPASAVPPAQGLHHEPTPHLTSPT